MLDRNVLEKEEQKEFEDFQGQDRGQDDQGKPSILGAYLNPNFHSHAWFINVYYLHCFITAISPAYSKCCDDSAPRVNLISPFEVTPFLLPNYT
jgi:hypothetical protein